MKKFFLLFMVIPVFLLIGACKTPPAAPEVVEETPPPVVEVEVEPELELEIEDDFEEEPEIEAEPEPEPEPVTVEQEFEDTYNRHRSDIILDGATSYTVVRGDTLTRIARRTYNDGAYYPLIMLASSDIVLDPDRIRPGMRLTVPNLKVNLEDPKANEALNKFLLEIATIEERRGRRGTAAMLRQRAAR